MAPVYAHPEFDRVGSLRESAVKPGRPKRDRKKIAASRRANRKNR